MVEIINTIMPSSLIKLDMLCLKFWQNGDIWEIVYNDFL